MPTQRECVCCREQPEAENKMQGRILSLYCIGRSKWKNNFFCKLLYILKGGLIKPGATSEYPATHALLKSTAPVVRSPQSAGKSICIYQVLPRSAVPQSMNKQQTKC